MSIEPTNLFAHLKTRVTIKTLFSFSCQIDETPTTVTMGTQDSGRGVITPPGSTRSMTKQPTGPPARSTTKQPPGSTEQHLTPEDLTSKRLEEKTTREKTTSTSPTQSSFPSKELISELLKHIWGAHWPSG